MARFIGNPLTLGSIRGGTDCVHMTAAERARHLYVVGATRTGKSKLLEDCIRQDILEWPRSGCGLMVLDRHGSLYDNLVKWSAALDLDQWPIVPIDLRRSDWIVSYNPLRRRTHGEEESVIVGNFVRSILHAWGQTDSNATPRLAKWLEATLFVLHTNGFTLAEALQLIVSPEIRRSLTAAVEDLVARSIWETAPLREPEFQEMVESTVNRLRKFLSRRVMRATLGQSHVSLDLSHALEQGQILLVSIATEGAKIDEEDASTIGSLLLSDLWMAAKARGKRDEGGVKPFYVYLDEFQEYVTPSMAETLDQASGFGLHMTFAHQFPSQLLKSDNGEQLYNSVLANCRSKVVFQLEHNDDVETLALMLYRQEVNLHKVKHEIYSTKVLDHKLQYLPSYGFGTSRSDGGGTQASHTEGKDYTKGTNWSHTDSTTDSLTLSTGTSNSVSQTESESESETDGVNSSVSQNHSASFGETDTDASTWGESEGNTLGESITDGSNWGATEGQSDSISIALSTNQSQSVGFGAPTEEFQDELAEFWNGELGEPGAENAFKRKWGQSASMSHGDSDTNSTSSGTSSGESSGGSTALSKSRGKSENQSRGGSHSHGLTRTTTDGTGVSEGASRAETRGTTLSNGMTRAHNSGIAASVGASHADSRGGSESWGSNSSDTEGTSTSWADTTSKTITHSPMLMPVYGKELSSVTFESVQDQLFGFAQYLSGQPDRHCVVKLVSKPPLAVLTLTVKPARTTDEWAAEWTTFIVKGLAFAVPMDEALNRIIERHRLMRDRLLVAPGEPQSTRIAIAVKATPVGEGRAPVKRMRRV